MFITTLPTTWRLDPAMRAILFVLLIAAATPSAVLADPSREASPINNWQDMRAAFVKCWTVPDGAEGSVVSFAFLLAPNGGLKGPPRVLSRILKGSPDAQQKFLASAYGTLDRCLPFSLTPAFKATLGEAIINLRFVNTPREPARNLGSWMSIFAEETRSR